MLKKLWEIKLTRFLVVGIFNTLFDLSILYTLVFALHVPTVIANLFSASISITSSYFLNHHIVFRSQEKHGVKRFAHFFAVTGIGILAIQSLVIYGVSSLLVHQRAAVEQLLHNLHATRISIKAFDLLVAKVIAVGVALAWNFTMYHFVVFKKPDQPLDDDLLA